MSGTSTKSGKSDVLIIRNWPKMVFMWPTALMSLVCGLIATFLPSWDHFFGGAFLICFTFNLLVITYDFPRSTSLTMLAAIVALVLGVILINQRYGIVAPLQAWLSSLDLKASADFYYAIFAGMFLLFIGMALITRFDYWELTSNELIHHTGLLGNIERFSTGGLKLNTEINDVFTALTLWPLSRIDRLIYQLMVPLCLLFIRRSATPPPSAPSMAQMK